MEYVIGAVVFLVIFFAGGKYMQIKAEKKKALKIKESFGLVPELEYTFEKYESIGYYYREMTEKDPENADHANIDNITWHDLDMDKVYMTLNATQCSIGEEYLYYLLRTPELKKDKLEEREELIEYFTKKAEKRVKLQSELSKAGRLGLECAQENVFAVRAGNGHPDRLLCSLGFIHDEIEIRLVHD
jgi:DNA mismatch repair ATPase MutS